MRLKPIERGYQRDFSKQFPIVLNASERRQKARKIIRILQESLQQSLSNLRCLEIGSSGGGMSVVFGEEFGFVAAGDIDLPAVELANKVNQSPNLNLQYAAIDAMALPFPENLFDVVICSHVYEHVPDAKRLMAEIERALAPGGICYFGCTNRFVLVEPHYGLPLLSLMPRKLATVSLRILSKGTEYHEKSLFYWELKSLVAKFYVSDFTWKVFLSPSKYELDIRLPIWVRIFQHVPPRLLKLLTPLLPSYLWVLTKRDNTRNSTFG